jgi:hypothetical protein
MSICKLVTLLFVAAACSSGGGSSPAAAPGAPRAARGGPNLITDAEIAQGAAGVQNALEIVERLRPSMLRARPSSTFGQGTAPAEGVLVYVDEVKLGDVNNLRNVPSSQIREIRFISATDATQRWGTGHGSGVIQVITKR